MDAETHGTQKELVKQVRKLHKTLQKLVARSHEFAELRKLLRERHIELAMYVVPVMNGAPVAQDLPSELTDTDKAFLKQAGISF